MINNTKSLIEFLFDSYIVDAPVSCDMTLGNGHDSKLILEKLNPKKLYAFDIQKAAFIESSKLLGDCPKVEYIHDGHENIDKYVEEKIDLAIYNLGYMPGQDKQITTNYKTVIESLEKVFLKLNTNGHIIITLYPGHKSGQEEAENINDFLSQLSQKEYVVTKFDFINQVNSPPYVILIEKIR